MPGIYRLQKYPVSMRNCRLSGGIQTHCCPHTRRGASTARDSRLARRRGPTLGWRSSHRPDLACKQSAKRLCRRCSFLTALLRESSCPARPTFLRIRNKKARHLQRSTMVPSTDIRAESESHYSARCGDTHKYILVLALCAAESLPQYTASRTSRGNSGNTPAARP